jgi:uncharacterized membrane protein
MHKLTSTVRIEAPVEVVFAFVDDWRNTTRYLRGLDRFEPKHPDRTQGLGAHFAAVVKLGPVKVDGEMEVVEHVPNERVVFVTIKGPKVRGEWVFRPDGDATIVELTNTFLDIPGGVAGRVVGKVLDTQAGKDLDGSLTDLKRIIEEGD